MGSEDKQNTGLSAWREKTAAAFTSGSFKLRTAAQAAGKNVSSAVDTGSSKLKTGWQATRENWSAKVQPRLNASFNSAREAAQRGSTAMKSSMLTTKEKMAQSKAGQRAVAASKSLVQRLDWRYRAGSSGKAVFGTPLEVIIQRQGTTARPIPRMVSCCVDYLVQSGLQSEFIFRQQGRQEVIQKLVQAFDQDPAAKIPTNTDPLDVAALLRLFFQMLPEPVLTYELYDEVVAAEGEPRKLHSLLKSLPPGNQATLETLTALLLRTSNVSPANKMSTRDLAIEFAPALLWPKPVNPSGSPTGTLRGSSKPSSPTKRKLSFGSEDDRANHEGTGEGTPSKHQRQSSGHVQTLDSETPAVVTPTRMPVNDTTREDAAVIEAVHVMIEKHDLVFADASEELWQEMGL